MVPKLLNSTLALILAALWTWGVSAATSRICPDCSIRLERDLPTTRVCDGTPPELVNKDTTGYEYVLTCGNKVERDTIPAGSKKELKNKSGCSIKLGENKAAKLYTEMVCTVQSAKITCDLL